MTLYMSSELDIIYMTKRPDEATPDQRDGTVEIEITDEMIEAGLAELNGYRAGWDDSSDVVCRIYQAMVGSRS